MSARSASAYVPIFPTTGSDEWHEKLSRRIDARVAELSTDRDVITVVNTPVTDDEGETLGVVVTVAWREP